MTDKRAREIIANTDVRTMRSGNFELETVGGHNADTILAALEAGGFAVVPKEPTEAMKVAGRTENSQYGRRVAEASYRAMLAAANLRGFGK